MAYFIQFSKSTKLIQLGRHRKFCKRSGHDRRLTQNRRKHNPFQATTTFTRNDQRVFIERRFQNERRDGWVRTSRWASTFDDITA